MCPCFIVSSFLKLFSWLVLCQNNLFCLQNDSNCFHSSMCVIKQIFKLNTLALPLVCGEQTQLTERVQINCSQMKVDPAPGQRTQAWGSDCTPETPPCSVEKNFPADIIKSKCIATTTDLSCICRLSSSVPFLAGSISILPGVLPLQVVNWKVCSVVQTNVVRGNSAAMANAVCQQIKIYPGGKTKQ